MTANSNNFSRKRFLKRLKKKNIFQELIIEAMEDMAIVHAIKEGEDSETVSKKEVFSILEGNA